MCLWASFKLNETQPSPYSNLESDPQKKDAGLELIPEIVFLKALQRTYGKITVSVRNAMSSPLKFGLS